MATLIELTDDEYAAQKAALAVRAEEYVVIGAVGIRDCVTRDIVKPGGIVRLDPAVKANILLVRARSVRKVEPKPATPATETKPAKAKADQEG